MKVRPEDGVRSLARPSHRKPWTSPRVITAKPARDTAVGTSSYQPEGVVTTNGFVGSAS